MHRAPRLHLATATARPAPQPTSEGDPIDATNPTGLPEPSPGYGIALLAVLLGQVAWHLADARAEIADALRAGGPGVEAHREALAELAASIAADAAALDALREVVRRRLRDWQARPQ